LNTKNKIKIFIADKIHEDGIKLLKKNFSVYKAYGLLNQELIEFINSKYARTKTPCALVVRISRKIDDSFIRQIKTNVSINVICTVSSGYDNIDIKSAAIHGIKVLNVPEGNFISAAEHTFAMLLAISKRLTEQHSKMRIKKFISRAGLTEEIWKKTIGIIGVGRVGSYVAQLAKSFGMNILGNDIKMSLKNKYRWIKFVPLNTLLMKSDYISIHTPLDDSTFHLINKDNIRLLNKNTVILNCARGGIIDDDVLYKALASNRIAYAGLDVFSNEPEIDFRFSELKNVLLSPHLAGKTKECYKRMALQAADRLINFYK